MRSRFNGTGTALAHGTNENTAKLDKYETISEGSVAGESPATRDCHGSPRGHFRATTPTCHNPDPVSRVRVFAGSGQENPSGYCSHNGSKVLNKNLSNDLKKYVHTL